MLTNERDKETVVELFKLGAMNYLVKPVKRLSLLEKLREIRSKLE